MPSITFASAESIRALTHRSGWERPCASSPRRCVFTDEGSLYHPCVKRAVDFIQLHYCDHLTLEEISAYACVSRCHLSRVFHRDTGVSFQDYVTHIRLEKAKQLLREIPQRSVTRIAVDVGFGSLRNFEKHFQHFALQTPSEYRAARQPQDRS